MPSTRQYALSLLLQTLPGFARAAAVSLPNTFTAGTPAKAAEVNANFTALATGLNAQDARIAALENTVNALVTSSTALQASTNSLQSSVISLQGDLAAAKDRIALLEARLASVSTLTVNGQPTVRFTGVNVQVVNGLGSTATANGTGNLVVGYDEPDTSGSPYCTIGSNPLLFFTFISDPTACAAAGGTWSVTGFKSGSHYLVTGTQNNYSRWGGVVSGVGNTSSYDWASVTGGSSNLASGRSSSITGGYMNRASGIFSSVGGGEANVATGYESAASGGYNSLASGITAWLGGGANNTANGNYSSVSGGVSNTASGLESSVSGGYTNEAAARFSSVLGGFTQRAVSDYQTIPALP